MSSFISKCIVLLESGNFVDFFTLILTHKNYYYAFENMDEVNLENPENICNILYCNIIKHARLEFFTYSINKYKYINLYRSLDDLKLFMKCRNIEFVYKLILYGILDPIFYVKFYMVISEYNDEELFNTALLNTCYDYLRITKYHVPIVNYFIDEYRFNNESLESALTMSSIFNHIINTFNPEIDEIPADMYQFRELAVSTAKDTHKHLIAACFGNPETVLKAVDLIGNMWCDSNYDTKYIRCKAKLILEYHEMMDDEKELEDAQERNLLLAIRKWNNSSGRTRSHNFRLMSIHIRASKFNNLATCM